VTISGGFESPESAYFDAFRQVWFVSNVAGSTPGDGFISMLGPDGEVLARNFATGLNDPGGQRVDAHTLYVADRTRIVAIDLDDPRKVTSIEIPGSQFLNDVTVDPLSHTVYVSDTFTDSIYAVQNGVPSLVLRNEALEAPNGLLYQSGALLIASIGPDLDRTTFATSAPGFVQKLDLDTLELRGLTPRFGALDGLERNARGLLVSDAFVGVYQANPDGTQDLLIENGKFGLGASADIGFDAGRRRVGVPELFGTRVAFFDLVTETPSH
jgi:DNA-binding beta-propeller fold protein YncE